MACVLADSNTSVTSRSWVAPFTLSLLKGDVEHGRAALRVQLGLSARTWPARPPGPARAPFRRGVRRGRYPFADIQHLMAPLHGVPAAAAAAARQSVFGGVAAASRLGPASLAHAARSAFAVGMDAALLASAGIAVVGALLHWHSCPGGPP